MGKDIQPLLQQSISVNRLSGTDADFPYYIEKTLRLYSAMDEAYAEAAGRFGFSCSGCGDNCCEEKFYHYTLIEHLCIAGGMNLTPGEKKREICGKAELVKKIYDANGAGGTHGRIMCPLNFSGLCVLYEYRPMICRLHGIPHLVKKSGRPDERGPGCHQFRTGKDSPDGPVGGLDRSPFYSEMAAIEIEFRKALRFTGRYKKTVAEMVLDISEGWKAV